MRSQESWVPDAPIMFSQLIPLALLPLAVMASPVMERSHKGKDLFCFHRKGQDHLYSDNKAVTKYVCATLSSGKFRDYLDNSCKVADYDVKWFKQRCESHNSKGDPAEWQAGSRLDEVWDPKEPFDLYCFLGSEVDEESTENVCLSVKSGKYNKTSKSCRVAKEDVDWFKKKCEIYAEAGTRDIDNSLSWTPGTFLKPSM